MNHHDAEVTDVYIVLEALDDDATQQVVEQLVAVGLTLCSVDNEKSVVEGSIVTQRLAELRKNPKVQYVRSSLSYTVDYPVGDPRNLDEPDDACDESED